METLGILDENNRKINATTMDPSSLSLIDKNTTNPDETRYWLFLRWTKKDQKVLFYITSG